MWRTSLALLAAASVLLMVIGKPERIFELWALGIGVTFVRWGGAAGFSWYSNVGWLLAVVALFDAGLLAAARSVAGLRFVSLVLLLPVIGLVTNRRYLWPSRPA